MREAAHAVPARALVEVEAGLLARHHVDAVRDAVLADRDRARERAAQHLVARREAFELPHLGVRALDDGRRARRRDERIGDRVAPAVRAGRQELHDDGVAVAIGDHAGKPVGLAVDESARGMVGVEHACPGVDRGAHALREPRRVDRRRCEGPGTCADLRRGRIRRGRDDGAVVRAHRDRVARGGRTVDALDRAREDPGMALRERLLAPGLQRDRRQAPPRHQPTATPTRLPIA